MSGGVEEWRIGDCGDVQTVEMCRLWRCGDCVDVQTVEMTLTLIGGEVFWTLRLILSVLYYSIRAIPITMSHSPLFQFLYACIPFPEIFGVPRIYGMLESLLSVEESGVQKLEKLCVQNLVEVAICNTKKAEELWQILDSSDPSGDISDDHSPFSPLVFGDNALISQFILNSTPLEPMVGLEGLEENEEITPLFVSVGPEDTIIALSGNRSFETLYPKNEIPIEKIIELSFVLFQRSAESVNFTISKEIPEAELIAEVFIELKNDERCRFNVVETELADDCIYVYFNKI